ncbi:NAD(P)-binding protein [Mytilinidion resinicola]|uniref:NAD(P)-binding protein n=1 Tax=Mytilinidion resinicola TaxID=574789 RepID=A0A6A6Z0M7_9PEZI|nr:NAD(P)-binding protein [Mytilinidion resinicola]KAF2814348.1 NAD(P)-binding protein [Mytilinidion resinicola]
MGSWFSTPWDPETGVPDLSGKVAVVTGANAGIGYEITAGLARKGAKVYLGARNKVKAEAAIERLHTENPTISQGSLIYLPLDLAELNEVVTATDTVIANEQRLDILVNNAGLATYSYQTTSAGFEMTMGVNHLAHFLLTLRLLPLLKRTAADPNSDVRIVNVSSAAHTMLIPPNLAFDTAADFKYHGPTSYPSWASRRDLFARYALSKLANILFASELQRRMDTEKVPLIATSYNPSGVNTEGGMSVWPAWMRPIMSRIFAPPAKGALTGLFVAAAPEVKREAARYKGKYFNEKARLEKPSKLAQDPQLARNLWELSEEALESFVKLGK